MKPASLTSLPDDLLLDIVEYLDTARDTSHLGRVAKHTHRLVQQAGWKTFVKTRFPSLQAPREDGRPWSSVADTLSYLDRCWDKRAIQLSLFRSQPQPRTRHSKHAPRRPRQAIDFHGIVDAHYAPSLGKEVVACGGGEDLHVRWGDDSTQTWRSILGDNTGYAPGTGDTTCLKIIERHPGLPEVVVGRANGDVQMLSAADNNKTFGKPTQTVIKLDQRQDAHLQAPLSISPGRLAVACTDWQPHANMLAACRSSHLHLYSIPVDGEEAHPKPLAYHDMSNNQPCNQESLIRDVKFLGRTNMAVALGASSQPIQYGSIRPTGVEFAPAPHNPDASDRRDGKLEPAASEAVTNVWSIQAVGHRDNSNLLLSSWHDGSFRLMDARTPSPYDAIYRDNFQPYHAGGPLLVYGTERFVSGNNTAPTLRFFDLRFPKPYLHSTALPCSPAEPRPRAACWSGVPDDDTTALCTRCEPANGRQCNWHAAMASPCFRQDTTLWLGQRGMDRVLSLAKASDASDKFYLGLRGAIAEAQLVLEEDIATRRQGRQSARPCPAGWRVSAMQNLAMADTGISLCTSSVHEASHGALHNGMPEMLYHCDASQKNQGLRELMAPPEGTRFDTAWRQQIEARQRGEARR